MALEGERTWLTCSVGSTVKSPWGAYRPPGNLNMQPGFQQEENTKRPKLGQRLGRKPVRRLERSKEVEENQVDITARNRQ